MSAPIVISGTIAYTNKRLKELRRQGYVVVSSRLWSDGKYSYTLKSKEDVEKKDEES